MINLNGHLLRFTFFSNKHSFQTVTSWDLSKSIATNSNQLQEIMTTTVKYCNAGDTIEEVARKMRKFDISCLPVVDEDMTVLGLLTTDQISNLLS